ncbi:MAG: SprT family zinc-dependent metalloprotease [Woeseiaceae bacterium]|nr:SprT family zinc-dependent metalloprotease [Woeseiaceae bacterium]
MQSAASQLTLFKEVEKPDADPSGFSVRVSGRAKRISIKVYPRGRVEVVAPKRARPKDVQAFVSEHREWIHKTRKAFAADVPPEAFELPQAIDLPGAGLSVRVAYRHKAGVSRIRFRRHGDVLVLTGNVDDEMQCVEALRRWLRSEARRTLEPQLELLSDLTGNAYKKLQIRGQKTCWGSHSSTGTISLNYSVLFLAPELVRYLLVHELCHAKHMNHSASYWSLVGRFEPDYKALDRRLSESWRDIPVWLGLH